MKLELAGKICAFLAFIFLYVLTFIEGARARFLRSELGESKVYSFVPDHKILRGMVLGYNEAASDLYWIQGLIYAGSREAKIGKFSYLHSYAKLILTMDPMFRRAYRWAGVMSIYTPKRITRRDVEKAIEYLKTGVEKFPDDGDLLSMLGFDLYYELPPFLETENDKKKAKLEGIEYFKKAVLSGNQPEWMVSLVSTLYSKNGRIDLAIKNLEENLKYVEDRDLRERMLKKLENLKGQRDYSAYISELYKLYTDWEKEFPYLSFDMYLIIRPKIVWTYGYQIEKSKIESAMEALDTLD